MKTLPLLLSVSFCIFFTSTTLAEDQKVNDFALIDHQGKFQKLSQYGNH